MSLQKLYSKKFETFDFTKEWKQAFGTPERSGMWLVYGAEKHGKTSFALKLAEYMSQFDRVLYISGEEGLSYAFVEACKRVKLEAKKNMQFDDYIPLEELKTKLTKQRSASIIVVDNITVYNDELKNGVLRKLAQKFPSKLFVYIAHEEQKQPYTNTAKTCKKLANIIVRVEGMQATISGRCPGGKMFIDEVQGKIYWGENINENQKKQS